MLVLHCNCTVVITFIATIQHLGHDAFVRRKDVLHVFGPSFDDLSEAFKSFGQIPTLLVMLGDLPASLWGRLACRLCSSRFLRASSLSSRHIRLYTV
jgi:hypothetical protein